MGNGGNHEKRKGGHLDIKGKKFSEKGPFVLKKKKKKKTTEKSKNSPGVGGGEFKHLLGGGGVFFFGPTLCVSNACRKSQKLSIEKGGKGESIIWKFLI